MSEYHITLQWNRQRPDFIYDTYDRSHQIRFGGGASVNASAGTEFLGQSDQVNPEEMLAASLSSCHMLTFLAIAAKSRYVVDSYEDQATAVLEKNETGVLAVTKIILKPRVKFSGEKQPDAEALRVLHEKSQKHCFIENSIRAKVVIEL